MLSKAQTGFIPNAIYISFTSLKDFLKCPHSYYLKNIYKDPKSGFRLQIASPYLTLGSTIHDSLKWYLEIQPQVTYEQLIEKFRNFWLKYRGKRGGFVSEEEESEFGHRGLKMLENFWKNRLVLERPVTNMAFPKMKLVDNLVLIGNFDFVGENKDGSLQIVDFKTGINDEEDSLQLYIYAILAEVNLGKSVSAAGFWYLDRDDGPSAIVLDPLEEKLTWLIKTSQELKKAIQKNQWACIKADQLCRDCQPYQALIDGKGEFQFTDYRYKKDIYFLAR